MVRVDLRFGAGGSAARMRLAADRIARRPLELTQALIHAGCQVAWSFSRLWAVQTSDHS